jgi:hypothetical protein
MTYFIVHAPYDKCFDLFFKDELGYPNFYRLSELLPNEAQYQDLILVAPYPTQNPPVLEKIAERINNLGIKYCPFGDGLETAFVFDKEGKLDTHPLFQQALHQAVAQFLEPASGKSAA